MAAGCSDVMSPSDKYRLDDEELDKLKEIGKNGDENAIMRIEKHYGSLNDDKSKEAWFRIGVESGSFRYRLRRSSELIANTSLDDKVKYPIDYKICASKYVIEKSPNLIYETKSLEDSNTILHNYMKANYYVLNSSRDRAESIDCSKIIQY
jgi:hypothetical protein